MAERQRRFCSGPASEWLHDPPAGATPFDGALGHTVPGFEPVYRVGYAVDPWGDRPGSLYVWPPGTLSAFPLDDRWTWEVHDDGTVTVTPSIGVGEGMKDYHGFLTRGRWVPA